jgi:DMSO reductase anchor subunit
VIDCVVVVVVVIIIIIIIIVSFMQGIHTHTPETNHVPRAYTVAAILSLMFMVPLSLVPALALLCFYVSTFRSMCAAPNMAVFCSSIIIAMNIHYYYRDEHNVMNINIITCLC